jgi:hypothetical protein
MHPKIIGESVVVDKYNWVGTLKFEKTGLIKPRYTDAVLSVTNSETKVIQDHIVKSDRFHKYTIKNPPESNNTLFLEDELVRYRRYDSEGRLVSIGTAKLVESTGTHVVKTDAYRSDGQWKISREDSISTSYGAGTKLSDTLKIIQGILKTNEEDNWLQNCLEYVIHDSK